MGEVRIGTSGWHYDSWWGPFFPDGVRKKDALRYYDQKSAAPHDACRLIEKVRGAHKSRAHVGRSSHPSSQPVSPHRS